MVEPQFTPCAVAFLDILGFERFIEAAERVDSHESRQFCELQTVISSQLEFNQTKDAPGQDHCFPSDVGLQIVHVSDSFVLSAPLCNDACPGYSGVVAVSIKSIQLAHQLLKMGFLVRGGLAVGNLYRTESNVFGTAYQAAYKTERCAGNPRVLFHQSAAAHLDTDAHMGVPLCGLSIFAKEGDEIILNTLAAHPTYVGDRTGIDVAETFRSYKKTIEQQLSELPRGRAREKWEWMARYFNAKQRHSIELTSVGTIEMDNYRLFQFGPLITHSGSTFQEAFASFLAPPLRTDGS
jgi:hypothetical protein